MSCRLYNVFLSIICDVFFLCINQLRRCTNSAQMKCRLVRIAWASISGSVAEWSKALVLGTSLFGGVGSGPTAAKFLFFFFFS